MNTKRTIAVVSALVGASLVAIVPATAAAAGAGVAGAGVAGAAPTAVAAPAARPVVWVDVKVNKAWPVSSAVKQVDKYTGTQFKLGRCKPNAECVVIREQKKNPKWAGVTYLGTPKSTILLNPSRRKAAHRERLGILVHELAHARGIVTHTNKCTSVMYYSTHCASGSVTPMKFTKAEKRILSKH